VCKAIANSQGWATDWAKSRQDCNAGGQQAAMASKNKDKEGLPAGPNNYTWMMLKKSYPNFDDSFREYLMTLVGTVIYTPAPNGNGAPTFSYIGPGDRAMMTALLDGGASAKILHCDNDTCMKPTLVTLNVSVAQAIKPKIANMIADMVGSVRMDSPLTAQQIALLGATNIPLYKIVTVNGAAQFGGMSAADVDNLAEIVSVDLLETVLKQFYTYIGQGSASFQNADEVSLGQWRDQIQEASRSLGAETASLSSRLERTKYVLDRTVWLERTLRNSMSPQMSASLNFTTGLSAQGLQ
jgi:conjugative transfer pilus assembly protein TraH